MRLTFFLPILTTSSNKREISPKKKDVIAWMVFIKYPKSSGDDLLLQTNFSDHGDHIFLRKKSDENVAILDRQKPKVSVKGLTTYRIE